MSTSTQPPKPKRRWYQFSLLTLLIVMTLFTVVVGWVGSRMNRARVNRDRVATSEKKIKKAVAAIENTGGEVTSSYKELRAQTWLEQQFGDPGGPDDPVGVLQVTKVDLRLRSVTDADLEHLKGLTTLQHLDLSWNKITDDGLEHLKGLTNLESLILNDVTIADAGLAHLKWLKSLQRLVLWDTNITDAGLEHLKGLKRLESLNLYDTDITDAGLVHLTALTDLRILTLQGTKVTDAGVKKLQQALPNCKIDF